MEKGDVSNRINWKVIAVTIIVTAIGSLIVGVVAPVVVNYINTPQLKLQFYSQDTIPFKTSTTQIASYQVIIKNDGSQVLDNLVCRIGIPNAIINQSTFLPNAPFTYSQENATTNVVIKIDNLNPKESGTVYILATSENQLPNQPDVQLRADGVTGGKALSTDNNTVSWYETVIMVMLVSFSAISMGFLTFRKGFQIINKKYNDQNDCLGYLCGNHGLYSEMDRYYNTKEVFFRTEADRLTTIAIKNQADRKKIQSILLDLLEYADHLSTVSKGVIHFDLAKIAKIDGDEALEKKHLEDAKRYASEITEARLKIDTSFK